MNESDQLKEDCRALIERSRTLHKRSERLLTHDAAQTDQLAALDQRCQAALEEAQHLQRCIPTGWVPTVSEHTDG